MRIIEVVDNPGPASADLPAIEKINSGKLVGKTLDGCEFKYFGKNETFSGFDPFYNVAIQHDRRLINGKVDVIEARFEYYWSAWSVEPHQWETSWVRIWIADDDGRITNDYTLNERLSCAEQTWIESIRAIIQLTKNAVDSHLTKYKR